MVAYGKTINGRRTINGRTHAPVSSLTVQCFIYLLIYFYLLIYTLFIWLSRWPTGVLSTIKGRPICSATWSRFVEQLSLRIRYKTNVLLSVTFSTYSYTWSSYTIYDKSPAYSDLYVYWSHHMEDVCRVSYCCSTQVYLQKVTLWRTLCRLVALASIQMYIIKMM